MNSAVTHKQANKSSAHFEKNTIIDMTQPPDMGLVCGPAIQEGITEVNRAFLNLCITAARLGSAEPLAPVLLGVSREVLDELANSGRASMLLAHAHGLPLVEMRFKDASLLRQIIGSGLGSAEAVSAITRAMPLEVITKGSKR